MNKQYDVFIRTWYAYGERDRYTGKRRMIPRIGRKTYLARGVDLQTAHDMCERYNSTHKPGRRSRKAEYMSI